MNFRKIYAMQKSAQGRIQKLIPDVDLERTGIYLFWRKDENGLKYAYVGKAQKQTLLARLGQHLLSYQHIDLSIKKHGLYSKSNPYGYHIDILCYCDPEQCDQKEKEYIAQYIKAGWYMRNVESGGTSGKTDIAVRKESKGYREGVEQGYRKARDYINEIFAKYLDFSIRITPDALTKDGRIKVSYQKKYDEFKEWINDRKN